jgi:hypothetical protein
MLSFDTFARPGWLIDNVSVTMSNVVPGVISITNNLWQSSWTLTGPLARNGSGPGKVISNAPPGEYVVQWSNVPFYVSPDRQTNNLPSGGSISFSANYTITDTNTNGLPDSWEQQFFGNVSANHPGTNDADHDGMSDFAEFIAGTIPTNSASVFKVTAMPPDSNHLIELDWNAAPGRGYRVLGSANGTSWSPSSEWLQATNRVFLSAPTNGAPYLFRVEVRP